MVNLESIRLDLEKRLSADREIHAIEVIADSIDECLQDASVQLNVKVQNLEYEVQEKIVKSFLDNHLKGEIDEQTL